MGRFTKYNKIVCNGNEEESRFTNTYKILEYITDELKIKTKIFFTRNGRMIYQTDSKDLVKGTKFGVNMK